MRYLITLTMGTEKNRFDESMDSGDVIWGLAAIRGALASQFGGYTEVVSRGGWVKDELDLIEEAGRQFQALTGEIDSLMEVDKLARSLASYAASALNQASVMYTFTPVTAGFVGPNEA